MEDKVQKPKSASHFFFDLAGKNLPGQETDEENESISVLEFICWMLGISVSVLFMTYLYHLLF
jgi:hypothetical protein